MISDGLSDDLADQTQRTWINTSMTPDETHKESDTSMSNFQGDVRFESSLSLGTQEGGRASGAMAH